MDFHDVRNLLGLEDGGVETRPHDCSGGVSEANISRSITAFYTYHHSTNTKTLIDESNAWISSQCCMYKMCHRSEIFRKPLGMHPQERPLERENRRELARVPPLLECSSIFHLLRGRCG